MTATQLPLAPAQRHNNQQLFSDYYLDRILPAHPDWQRLAANAAPLMQHIAAIYAAYTPSRNEAQLERELVRPVLEALGHTFEVQAALYTPDNVKKPDYVFYRNDAAMLANKGVTLDEERLRAGAFAVGDAKAWELPLDTATKKAGADPFTNKNPSYQIAFYMQHSGLPWGILTNGRLWRLYHKGSAYKLNRYYEVDLPALLATENAEAFLFFALFFGRAAFNEQPLGVAAILRESSDYARGVGDTLKQQVYDALRHLAQGFLDHPVNGLAADAATLKQIYDASLIVLYRLLFILYAEARELLPLRESELYRNEYSLSAITRDVARKLQSNTFLLPTSAGLWQRLRDLFHIIDVGSPLLKVATFNGGLFDPKRHTFLEHYVIGDARLQQAIDKIARAKGQFIDYRDLAERHLGSVYEGLLEYQLQPLATPEDGWTVTLLNNNGERHSSGSYYTPDWVVRYIVDTTLGPLLRDAVANKTTDDEKIAAILDVNCLDMSMGSGHFPVAATEYIAQFIIEEAISPEGDAQGETDLQYWKRRVAQSCIYGVDLNPLAVELAKLSLWLSTAAKGKPLSFLDHHLRCGNALVGSRLADLRLGGEARPKGKGKQAQQQAAGQLSMLDDDAFRRSLSHAVDYMWLIEQSAGNTVAEVKEQERAYAALRADLDRKYGALANLVTASHWGVCVDEGLRPQVDAYVRARDGGFAMPALERLLEQAEAVAQQQHFFHYELAFPEVFFDKHGQALGDRAGFDAVVGNPPYVRQEQLAPVKPYLADAQRAVYHGAADLYVYFYAQGLELLRRGGRLSYIVTNKWLRAGYGEPLRAYFAQHAQVEQIIDFGHAPIFEDADVFPCIVVVEKPPSGDATKQGEPAGERETQVVAFPREALGRVPLDSYVQRHAYRVPQRRWSAAPWSLEANDVDALMAKIKRAGVPLVEYAGVKPYRGVLTGFNEAFLIDTPTKERLIREDARSAEIIKPYLRGQDIKRWSPEWDGLWMIFARRGIDINQYSAIKQHLQQFRTQLEPQPKGWSGGKWQGRKQGTYKWFEIQDSVDYWPLFEQPKLVYQEIQFHPSYCLDTGNYFGNNKTFVLPTGDLWLLAVLNSPLTWWHNWRYLPHMKDEALTPLGFLVEQLPIAPPSDAARDEAAAAVARLIAITRTNQETRRDMLDWLRLEFDVATPGQRLEGFAALDLDTFVAEVGKRRPKAAGKRGPAALRALKDGYTEQAEPLRARQGEAQQLEQRLAALVNAAYGLSAEDVALLWQTAPPRMPVGQ